MYTEVEAAFFDPNNTSGTTCAVQLDHDQQWIRSDYSSEISDAFVNRSKFTSPAGAAECASIGIKDASSMNNPAITEQGPEKGAFPITVAGWKSLSTDPATLLQKIHQIDGGDNTPAEEFVNISDALKAIPVPVASLQALYQAVALIPGVRVMGSQTDAAGQSGLGVEITSKAGYTSRMIFDQQTGRLLADEQYDPSGTLYQAEEYVAQKIVDSAPPHELGDDLDAHELSALNSPRASCGAKQIGSPSGSCETAPPARSAAHSSRAGERSAVPAQQPRRHALDSAQDHQHIRRRLPVVSCWASPRAVFSRQSRRRRSRRNLCSCVELRERLGIGLACPRVHL